MEKFEQFFSDILFLKSNPWMDSILKFYFAKIAKYGTHPPFGRMKPKVIIGANADSTSLSNSLFSTSGTCIDGKNNHYIIKGRSEIAPH